MDWGVLVGTGLDSFAEELEEVALGLGDILLLGVLDHGWGNSNYDLNY